MTDMKLGILPAVLLAVIIGCGGAGRKGDDPQSRMKRYAPKDAVVAIYLDVSAAREGLVDFAKKYPEEAKQIDLDGFMGVLDKIDAVSLYLMGAEGQAPRVLVIHGEVRPGDLTGMFAKLLGAPELAESGLTSKGNGRYKLGEAPILIIDGREADDLDGNVIVAGTAETLTAGFVAALGKGQCPAVTLAIDKADTSATLWGGVVFDKPSDPGLPQTGIFSANLAGDKLFGIEMTSKNLEFVAEAEKELQGNMRVFGDAMVLKRSGTTLTIESTRGGNLADLVVPSIRRELEEAKQVACKSNLFDIGARCAMYRAERKDAKYPENLKVLLDMHLLYPSVLRCPSDSSRRACSYLYVAPLPEEPSQTLMACDLKGNHENIRNVGFAGGGAASMTEEEFQAALKLPRNAKFAAALEKAGG